jgi:hypothetical protein
MFEAPSSSHVANGPSTAAAECGMQWKRRRRMTELARGADMKDFTNLFSVAVLGVFRMGPF